MRSVVLFVIAFFAMEGYSSSFADFLKKETNLGINVGTKMLFMETDSYGEKSTYPGYSIGLHYEKNLTENLYLVPRVELSSNVMYITRTAENVTNIYEIFGTSLDWMIHSKYAIGTSESRPYIFAGGHIKPRINQKYLAAGQKNNPSYGLDFGIGFDKALTKFNFAPEVRYSYGLNDINNNPDFDPIYFHSLALILNFK